MMLEEIREALTAANPFVPKTCTDNSGSYSDLEEQENEERVGTQRPSERSGPILLIQKHALHAIGSAQGPTKMPRRRKRFSFRAW
jgi:hypothetical protein